MTAVFRSAAILAAFLACRQDAGATGFVTIFWNPQQMGGEQPSCGYFQEIRGAGMGREKRIHRPYPATRLAGVQHRQQNARAFEAGTVSHALLVIPDTHPPHCDKPRPGICLSVGGAVSPASTACKQPGRIVAVRAGSSLGTLSAWRAYPPSTTAICGSCSTWSQKT